MAALREQGIGARAALRFNPSSPLLVALLGVLPYLQTLWFGLVDYDDPWLIQDNTLLREPSGAGLAQVWLDLSPELRLRLGAEYLPIRDMSVMLDNALFGAWYGGHHLTSVLLYGLLCGLVAAALQAWTGRRWLAWTAALLYALHPLHAESAAWLSERKGLLAGVLLFAAALTFRRFARRPSAGAWLATAVFLVLAVWSKATGVGGPALLAALLWFFPPHREPDDISSRRDRRVWLGLAGMTAAAAAAFAPVWLVGNRLVVETTYHGGDVGSTAWLMARVLGVYMEHLLLGGPLGIQYAAPQSAATAAAGAGCALVLAAVAVVGVVRRGRWAVPGFAAVCWWIFFLPVSQLLVPLQNYLADRYMLMASLGFCLLLALGVRSISVRALRVGLVLVMVGLAGTMATVQARSWRSSAALFEQALRAHPRNIHAMIQQATLAVKAGDRAGAARWLARARKVRPEDSRVLLHQGLLLHRSGRPREALALFSQAARVDSRADKARANLALLLSGRGQKKRALRWARQATRIRPLSAHNQRTLGVVALGNGLLEEAQAAFTRAQRLEPHNARNAYNLGVVALKRGQQAAAIRWLQRALALDPGDRDARGILQELKRKGRRTITPR